MPTLHDCARRNPWWALLRRYARGYVGCNFANAAAILGILARTGGCCVRRTLVTALPTADAARMGWYGLARNIRCHGTGRAPWARICNRIARAFLHRCRESTVVVDVVAWHSKHKMELGAVTNVELSVP